MNKLQIDASESRNVQARQIVAAAKQKHRDPVHFEGLMVGLLSSVLENEWVDKELESNIRLLWAELVDAEVVNDDLLNPEDGSWEVFLKQLRIK